MKATIIGTGKLGLCFALNLNEVGVGVLGLDVDENYVSSLNNKTFKSEEPQVNDLLHETKAEFTTDLEKAIEFSDYWFVFLPTPSLKTGYYDHSSIEKVKDEIIEYAHKYAMHKGLKSDVHDPQSAEGHWRKHLIICCTVMPGYCKKLKEDFQKANVPITVSYNPEFIAQGTIINNQLEPDLVLLGTEYAIVRKYLTKLYDKLVLNSPKTVVMSPTSAEVCKLALNCFLTTKIAFANMVGDIAQALDEPPAPILEAIGSDSRIGDKYISYGFGFGGPCFPRDNRALNLAAKEHGVYNFISEATDLSNKEHVRHMAEAMLKEKGNHITFEGIGYKEGSSIIEESQALAVAIYIAKLKDTVVIIKESKSVMKRLNDLFPGFFVLQERCS